MIFYCIQRFYDCFLLLVLNFYYSPSNMQQVRNEFYSGQYKTIEFCNWKEVGPVNNQVSCHETSLHRFRTLARVNFSTEFNFTISYSIDIWESIKDDFKRDIYPHFGSIQKARPLPSNYDFGYEWFFFSYSEKYLVVRTLLFHKKHQTLSYFDYPQVGD